MDRLRRADGFTDRHHSRLGLQICGWMSDFATYSPDGWGPTDVVGRDRRYDQIAEIKRHCPDGVVPGLMPRCSFKAETLAAAGEAVVAEEAAVGGSVELPDAIEALRRDLAMAWWDGRHHRVRFRVEPVELTIQAGVTRTGKGSAGIKWHVLTLGGERSRETTATQTLKLRLTPVLYDEHGVKLPDADQLISDRDESGGRLNDLEHEPE